MFASLGLQKLGIRKIGFGKEVEGIPKPTNLATSGITTSTITLFWDDDVSIDHWEVYLDGVLVDDTVATNSFEFTGLDSGTEYVLGVKSVDADDNKSALATKVSATISPSLADALLLESGSFILLENGDKLLIE